MTKQTYVILGIILIIVLVLAGAVFVLEKQKEPAPVTPAPVSQPPVITPTPPVVTPTTNQTNQTPQTPQTIQTPKGWKTYRNEELGFELAYPGEWFVYDDKKIKEDEHNFGPCIGLYKRSMVAFSKENLGRCVGASGDTLLRGDLSVHLFNGRTSMESPIELPEDGSQIKKIEIDNIPAWMAFFTDNSVRPRDFSVNIYVNHPKQNHNYLITFPQVDKNGKYDPLFNKILSTFRFLK